jgi:hypothetical protein
LTVGPGDRFAPTAAVPSRACSVDVIAARTGQRTHGTDAVDGVRCETRGCQVATLLSQDRSVDGVLVWRIVTGGGWLGKLNLACDHPSTTEEQIKSIESLASKNVRRPSGSGKTALGTGTAAPLVNTVGMFLLLFPLAPLGQTDFASVRSLSSSLLRRARSRQALRTRGRPRPPFPRASRRPAPEPRGGSRDRPWERLA